MPNTTPAFCLIDDNEIDQLLHRKIIELAFPNAAIVQFTNPVKALAHISENIVSHPIHLLLDIKMPIMDGFQFLEAFDKLPEMVKNQYLIYMVSSSSNQFDLSKAKSNPYVKQIITKPIDSNSLIKAIASH